MAVKSPLQDYLDQLHSRLCNFNEGALADYIPELAKANPDWFGIAIVTVDGQIYQVGDCNQLFTIQSASKPIAYGLALQDRGIEAVKEVVGVEPSGEAFNSISLDPECGRPKNPMINAGAIATTSLIKGDDSNEQFERLTDMFSKFMGHPPGLDEEVLVSERKTGHRNRALNNLMRTFGIVPDDNDESLDVYFKQCSLSVNCLDLANIAACLANAGVNPITSVQALQSKYVVQVLSVMSSCGMYDYSGAWVYDVGMPAKSGVGGGIMAVLPGQFGVAVFSPLLDDIGNSARGIEVCRQISQDFNLHLFHTQRSTTSSVIRDRCDGSVARSRRTRHPEEKAILASNGHKIKMYSLQGELMFGAADAITQHIAHEMEETSCTVIDLNHVLDIDQASIRLFKELINKLHFDGKIILFTYTENKYGFMKQINKGVEILHDISVFEFSDNDRALEWCEDYLLKQERGIFDRFHIASLEKQKLCVGLSAAQIKILNACGKLVNLDEDEKLFSIDDPAHSLFFVLQGEMSVQLENKRGLPRRLTTVHAGMSVGELTLVNGQARSADVVAITPVELLEVDFASIPDDIESLFLRNIALQLSMKIAEDNHSQPLGN